MVLLMYSILKFSHLASKHNPNISTFLKVDELTGQYLNLNEHRFRFAVTIESYLSPRVQKNDPRYIKYLFRYYGKHKGVYFQKMLPYHRCTDEDYAKFNPVKK